VDEEGCLFDGYGSPSEHANTSLQEFCTNILVLRNKANAFKEKLALWDSLSQEGDTEMFSTKRFFDKR